MFCKNCGSEVSEKAAVCVKCGVATGVGVIPGVPVAGAKSRVAYILLGIFLGGFGIHNFYAGYTGKGVAQLLITLFGFWLVLPLFAVGIWVLVEIITVKADSQGVPFT
ncbi:MAG: TM2 domain-containing protein [Acidobacteria bacterium]|nr:MAG: TM2 domain-containing protein [Acidobacteriota bacterium]